MGELLRRMSAAAADCGFPDIPIELLLLVEWIETHGEVRTIRGTDRWCGTPDTTDNPRGTRFAVMEVGPAKTADLLAAWFPGTPVERRPVLWPFASTGSDGSHALLWRPGPAEEPRIVHLGTGSGSMLVCELGATPLDFLRLLAIGYVEICWPDEYAAEPQPDPPDRSTLNHELRQWVVSTFGTTIPRTASEVVAHPDELTDDDPQDPFCRVVLPLC